MFRALRHRNFRLIWIGLLVSFSGSFMQNAAILWHVSILVPADRRALALGMVGLVRIVPIIVFSMISGVAADAFDRRRLMLITQTIMALVAAVTRLPHISRSFSSLADLYAGRGELRGGSLRSAGTTVAGADTRASCRSSERHQSERNHVAAGVGRWPGLRRLRDWLRRAGVGLRLQRRVVPRW